MIILGIHPGYHDAGACVFDDYRMRAAVSLERLTRRKTDGGRMPVEAIDECLRIAGIEQGHDIGRLAHAMLESHWRENSDLADRDTLAGLARAVNLDPAPLFDAAGSPEVAAIYRANTDEAIDRSVFGSPTYFVDGDMFYGQDRLEFVERALTQPFKGAWPRNT